MTTEETVSSSVARLLVASGVKQVYVYPGGTIAPLIHALEEAGIELLVFRSEQGAGFAAIGDARVTGRLSVVLVSSGPGVTNVLTPVADAYYDSVPLLVIAGQVSTGDISSGRLVRQRGFQETPTVALTSPIAKFSAQITPDTSAVRIVREAIERATSGRAGPSVIDFPIDLQKSSTPHEDTASIDLQAHGFLSDVFETNDGEYSKVAEVLLSSKRRLLLLGQGARTGVSASEIEKFVRRHSFMVVTSFLGIGAFESESDYSLGYIGHTGHAAANQAVASCDFLLVLGSRLDVRQTGTEVQDFAPLATVCWVDIDDSELDNPRVNVDFAIRANAREFVAEFSLLTARSQIVEPDLVWKERLVRAKKQCLEDVPRKLSTTIQPRVLLKDLDQLLKNQSPIVVTGVGLHQQWVARHMSFGPKSATLLSSGGHGTMGFDIPAAIGAKLSNPDKTVICIVGDGSAYMNIQELGFVSDNQVDVRFLAINNGKLGIVSQFQKINWGKDPTTGSFGGISLASVAGGFGIESTRVSSVTELRRGLEWLIDGSSSRFLEVAVDPAAVVSPMLLAGQKMNEMSFFGDSHEVS